MKPPWLLLLISDLNSQFHSRQTNSINRPPGDARGACIERSVSFGLNTDIVFQKLNSGGVCPEHQLKKVISTSERDRNDFRGQNENKKMPKQRIP